MSFSLDIKSWADASAQDLVDAKKGAAMTLIRRVLADTPIDSGRLINNWRTGIDKRNGSALTGEDPSGERSMSEAESKIRTVQGDETIIFSNNLPYAPVVEFGLYPNPPKNPTGKTVNGFSTQSRKGMARINVQKMALDISRDPNAWALAGKRL